MAKKVPRLTVFDKLSEIFSTTLMDSVKMYQVYFTYQNFWWQRKFGSFHKPVFMKVMQWLQIILKESEMFKNKITPLSPIFRCYWIVTLHLSLNDFSLIFFTKICVHVQWCTHFKTDFLKVWFFWLPARYFALHVYFCSWFFGTQSQVWLVNKLQKAQNFFF